MCFAGIQNSFVLGYRCDDDGFTLAGVHFKYTFDGQVIAFGCPLVKMISLIGANQFGHLFTGIIDSFFRPAVLVVPAGRIRNDSGTVPFSSTPGDPWVW